MPNAAVTIPKFRRRKADRPAEIVRAALQVFSEKGFAAARLEEIAALAGVSKGAIYLYFPTKQDIFRAVVEQAIAPQIAFVKTAIATHPGPFPALVRLLAERFTAMAVGSRLGGVVKMVIGEARNFPELAKIWHDQLVSQMIGALSTAVAAAQARGEVRAGDPRTFALQIVAPLMVGVIWRETFTPVGAPDFDISALAAQHIQTLLEGILAREAE